MLNAIGMPKKISSLQRYRLTMPELHEVGQLMKIFVYPFKPLQVQLFVPGYARMSKGTKECKHYCLLVQRKDQERGPEYTFLHQVAHFLRLTRRKPSNSEFEQHTDTTHLQSIVNCVCVCVSVCVRVCMSVCVCVCMFPCSVLQVNIPASLFLAERTAGLNLANFPV